MRTQSLEVPQSRQTKISIWKTTPLRLLKYFTFDILPFFLLFLLLIFYLWTNGKTFFKIEEKTKFYHQSLSELQTLSHLEAMLSTSKELKEVLQLTRISSEGCVHWPVPVPNRRGLLHLLQRRSWRPWSALALHAALWGEKTHHSRGKQSHCKVTASTGNKKPRQHVLPPPGVNQHWAGPTFTQISLASSRLGEVKFWPWELWLKMWFITTYRRTQVSSH